MHTLTRRALYDNFDPNDLFHKLDRGVDPTDPPDDELLAKFNRFKATRGAKWAKIRTQCEDWSDGEWDESD